MQYKLGKVLAVAGIVDSNICFVGKSSIKYPDVQECDARMLNSTTSARLKKNTTTALKNSRGKPN